MHKDSLLACLVAVSLRSPRICNNNNNDNAAVLHAITIHTFLQVWKSLVMNFETTFF